MSNAAVWESGEKERDDYVIMFFRKSPDNKRLPPCEVLIDALR
jgi:hypothetical protein